VGYAVAVTDTHSLNLWDWVLVGHPIPQLPRNELSVGGDEVLFAGGLAGVVADGVE
jgi:hypothetical protein